MRHLLMAAAAATVFAAPAQAGVIILNYNWGNVFQINSIDVTPCAGFVCTYTTSAYLDFDARNGFDTAGTLTFSGSPGPQSPLIQAQGLLRFEGRNGLVLDANLSTRSGYFDFPDGRRVTFTNMENGIPEPATWAMMIAGFGLAGGALRRHRGRLAVSHA